MCDTLTKCLCRLTEKEKDTAEKTVEELKRQLQPKRARTDDDAGDAHQVIAEVENWDLGHPQVRGVQGCVFWER